MNQSWPISRRLSRRPLRSLRNLSNDKISMKSAISCHNRESSMANLTLLILLRLFGSGFLCLKKLTRISVNDKLYQPGLAVSSSIAIEISTSISIDVVCQTNGFSIRDLIRDPLKCRQRANRKTFYPFSTNIIFPFFFQ